VERIEERGILNKNGPPLPSPLLHPVEEREKKSLPDGFEKVSDGLPYHGSIHPHEDGGTFGALHHVLELPFLRERLLEFNGHFGHGFLEAQEVTALHRVIRVPR